MKVTVSFAETKVVVPCGDGSILVKVLAEMAACRFRKSAGLSFTTLAEANLEGGISSTTHVVQAVGEMEGRLARHRFPTATIFIVEALMLARDGGILDWDDCANEVMDDRELLLAKFKWDLPNIESTEAMTTTQCNGEVDFNMNSSSESATSLSGDFCTQTCQPQNYSQITPSPIISDLPIVQAGEKNLEPIKTVNQPPDPLSHRFLVERDPRDVYTSSLISTTAIATSPPSNPIGTSVRRPAPPPPPPPPPPPFSPGAVHPPLTSPTASTPVSTCDATLAIEMSAKALKNETGCTPSLATETATPSLTDPYLDEFRRCAPLSEIPEEDDNASQASTVVVLSQSLHRTSRPSSPCTASSVTTTMLISSPQLTPSLLQSPHDTSKANGVTEKTSQLCEKSNETSEMELATGIFKLRRDSTGQRACTKDDTEISQTPNQSDLERTNHAQASDSVPVSTNEHESAPSVWQLRTPLQSKSRNANFNGVQKPPPPPPPITAASAAVVSTTSTSSNVPTDPIVTHKDITPLVNATGHIAPPPPPKRFPQTVLSAKPENFSTTVSSSEPPQPLVRSPPPVSIQSPPTKEASTVALSPVSTVLPSHLCVDQSTSISKEAASVEDEASVLHMTDLLIRKHASNSVKDYLLSAAAERERRLQAAAVNVVTFRRRVPAVQGHPLFEATRETNSGNVTVERPTSTIVSSVLPTKEEINIHLIKAAAGLGFSLTTKDVFLGAYSASRASPTKVQPLQQQQTVHLMPIYGRAVCVKSIIPGGAALKDGSLRVGDRLLMVDREDVSTASQAQIVALLRMKPIGSQVELVVRRIKWLASTATKVSTLKRVDNTPTYQPLSACSSLNTSSSISPHWEDSGPHQMVTVDDSQLGSHSQQSEKCIYLKLNICLQPLETQISVGREGISDGNDGSGMTIIRKNQLAAMRLGVSVREVLPNCFTGSDCTSGIFVKSLIEGGAAHVDGRLCVGDEILEVNGVSLINTSDPLSLLRAVLKHISLSPSNAIPNYPNNEQSCDFPVVSLRIARRISEITNFTSTSDTARPSDMPSYALQIFADVHATSAAAIATTSTSESVSKSSTSGLQGSLPSPATLRKKRVAPNPAQYASPIQQPPSSATTAPQTKKTHTDKKILPSL